MASSGKLQTELPIFPTEVNILFLIEAEALVIQKTTLKEQLKDYTKRLIEFERIHRLVRRYGLQTTFLEYPNTRRVEDQLIGGYERSLSTYQCFVHENPRLKTDYKFSKPKKLPSKWQLH